MQSIFALEAYQTMGVFRLSTGAFYDIDHKIHFSFAAWKYSVGRLENLESSQLIIMCSEELNAASGWPSGKQKSLEFLPFKVYE